MFDPSTDPLGIAVRQRAAQQRWQNIYNGLNPTTGPLPDPQWEGYFQATSEAADGKPVKWGNGSAGTANPETGLDANNPMPLSMQMLMRSNQIGTPLYNKSTAFQSKLPKVPTSGQTGYDPTSQTT